MGKDVTGQFLSHSNKHKLFNKYHTIIHFYNSQNVGCPGSRRHPTFVTGTRHIFYKKNIELIAMLAFTMFIPVNVKAIQSGTDMTQLVKSGFLCCTDAIVTA